MSSRWMFRAQYWRRHSRARNPAADGRNHQRSGGSDRILGPRTDGGGRAGGRRSGSCRRARSHHGEEGRAGSGRGQPRPRRACEGEGSEEVDPSELRRRERMWTKQLRPFAWSPDWVIPGREYQRTRHNVGFEVARSSGRGWGLPWEHSEKWHAFWAKSERDSGQTRNLHESQRRSRSRRSRISTRSRPRKFSSSWTIWRSSSGGCAFGRKGAPGVTTGSNRSFDSSGPKRSRDCASASAPRPREGAVDYVLGRFFEEEQPVVEKTIERAADAVKCAIDKGLLSAMNLFNKIPES